MWTNLFLLLFAIYAWGCAVASLLHICGENRRLDEHFDEVFGRELP